MSGPLAAAWWGLVAGSALLIGALLGYFVKLPQRLIAGVMALCRVDHSGGVSRGVRVE